MRNKLILFVVASALTFTVRAADPLPSWQEGASKTAILEFVAKVTKVGGPHFVAEEERVATFDNDGTLWTERPFYTHDHDGKPVAINRFIGRRPIAAFGNSDGDLEMLQWTAAGDGARLALIVHHTDEVRETAYDRKSKIGRLDKGLDEAAAKGWTVVNMKSDWKTIFPPAK